jgi:hypothetical protein
VAPRPTAIRPPSTLVKEIVERASGTRPNSVLGTRWWVDEQGNDLNELASTYTSETTI